jgi:rsbT co-antagonist protein RsbR
MATEANSIIPSVLAKNHDQLLRSWIELQRMDAPTASGRLDPATVADHSKRFLEQLRAATQTGRFDDIRASEWSGMRDLLEEVSRVRATQGATPSETATVVFSLKEPLFNQLQRDLGDDARRLASEIWRATLLLDKLGLYTTEVAQRTRDEIISRQQDEMLELSTPVVELWDSVLALPLIGTLDSARTQVVMENLLQRIVSSGAEIAIIDITGVPTVDTLVAQHLLKTISAARLMGADCIISGIRPQIAQTIVHLGVQLDVVSKATMADAFALALRRIGKTVVDRAAPRAAQE